MTLYFARYPLALTLAFAALPPAQTCPPVTLLTTPRIYAGDKNVIVTTRQNDGSFEAFYGPRIAPLLMTSSVPNIQTAVTSCFPVSNKSGSVPFSTYDRQGWASQLGDWGDLDGDGVEDAVLIGYKPNVAFVVLMSSSNVPKPGYPTQVTIPGPPLSLRLADVNEDGSPDLIVATGDGPGGAGAIYVALNQGNGSFGPAVRYAAAAEPLGFTVADINNDHHLDIIVAGQGDLSGAGAGIAVLLGNGNGTFSSPSNFQTLSPAYSVVVGDFNGDGKPDIAAATGTTVTTFFGNGTGGFSSRATYPSGGDSVYLAMGDFNGDGKLDLAVSNYNQQTVSVLLNAGAGTFGAPVSYAIAHGRSPEFLIVTDFNNDGVPDIVGGVGRSSIIAGNSTNAIDVLIGNGDGTFQAPAVVSVSNAAPLAFAAAGDFNNDKKPDVVAMAQKSTSLLFYAGRGDNSFQAPVTTALGSNYANAIGAVSGDFNGDGVPDVAILTNAGFAIALSQKNGSFQPLNTLYHAALTINGLAVADFNGDGKPDIATYLCNTGGGQTPIHIYTGSGSGSFSDTMPIFLNYCPSALITADLNGDGKPDLISLNDATPGGGAYSSVDVFLNQGQGSWSTAKAYGLDATGVVAIAVGDINHDNKPDIVAASQGTRPFSITAIVNNGDGTFAPRVTTPLSLVVTYVSLADLNGDGNADLILSFGNAPGAGSTYDLAYALSNGDGTFQAPVHFAAPNPAAIQIADFNGDGRPDLLYSSPPSAPFGYFGVLATGSPAAVTPVATVVNAASSAAGQPVAAESIVSAFGPHLGTSSAGASSLPLPTNLLGTTVKLVDSAGSSSLTPLFYVGTGQVNFEVPPGSATGTATVTVTSGDGVVTSGKLQIANVAPGIFPVPSNPPGLASGYLTRVHTDGTQTTEQDYQLDANNNVIPLAVNLSPATDQLFLVTFGTGLRHASKVTATVGGISIPVAFSGPQGVFAGEDQVDIGPFPQSLAGKGSANIVVTADGITANTVNITFK
jgi:uncharacterized protein (TIGR03437 family)